MPDVSFDPPQIRALSQRVSTPLRAGAAAARGQVSGAQMTLPRCLQQQEGEINRLLARIPTAIDALAAMASDFETKMHASAAAYEQVEQDNAQHARGAGVVDA